MHSYLPLTMLSSQQQQQRQQQRQQQALHAAFHPAASVDTVLPANILGLLVFFLVSGNCPPSFRVFPPGLQGNCPPFVR